MENGWSLKWLHREIVLSATYGQSSTGNPQAEKLDPANTLLARMPRRRMSIEQWRDAILSVSGRLGSPSRRESIDPQDPKSRRSTVYSKISRLELNHMLALFDFPDPNTHSERRVETTTPLQKLFAMNSPFMVAQAEALAKRLIETSPENEDRITRAYELCYGRPPRAEEKAACRGVLWKRTGFLGPLDAVCPGAVGVERIVVYRLSGTALAAGPTHPTGSFRIKIKSTIKIKIEIKKEAYHG